MPPAGGPVSSAESVIQPRGFCPVSAAEAVIQPTGVLPVSAAVKEIRPVDIVPVSAADSIEVSAVTVTGEPARFLKMIKIMNLSKGYIL